jgi:hypothetical protein
MASRDHTVIKQVTAGKRQHPTLTVPQKHEIIRRWKKLASYNIRSLTVYAIKKQNGQIMIISGIK